jgi:hypothetical protein
LHNVCGIVEVCRPWCFEVVLLVMVPLSVAEERSAHSAEEVYVGVHVRGFNIDCRVPHMPYLDVLYRY